MKMIDGLLTSSTPARITRCDTLLVEQDPVSHCQLPAISPKASLLQVHKDVLYRLKPSRAGDAVIIVQRAYGALALLC